MAARQPASGWPRRRRRQPAAQAPGSAEGSAGSSSGSSGRLASKIAPVSPIRRIRSGTARVRARGFRPCFCSSASMALIDSARAPSSSFRFPPRGRPVPPAADVGHAAAEAGKAAQHDDFQQQHGHCAEQQPRPEQREHQVADGREPLPVDLPGSRCAAPDPLRHTHPAAGCRRRCAVRPAAGPVPPAAPARRGPAPATPPGLPCPGV